MHETGDDVVALQRLLDNTYARAGQHLRSIHTPDRRIPAAELVRVMQGVRVLDLATVNAAGAPRVSPVDGIFFRGQFWFGSADESVRFRHLRVRPQVSAAHTVGETFAVVVHGTAFEIDVSAAEYRPFRETLLEVYPDWEQWWSERPPPYARIDATHMYAYAFDPAVLEDL
ncbi:MAG TPA: pyridoxamine 5'-phosphate oxidase family protein [Acidimicrobiia bacterium]|nr:pyridoxamine 5'-phosphate oxidase family protein [Acidimicrobiia bacterium]